MGLSSLTAGHRIEPFRYSQTLKGTENMFLFEELG